MISHGWDHVSSSGQTGISPEDEIFALLNRCPHKGGPLSEGIIYGRTVTCSMHNWCIGLNNGEAVAPDEGCAPVYPVKVEDSTVYLSLQAQSCIDEE